MKYSIGTFHTLWWTAMETLDKMYTHLCELGWKEYHETTLWIWLRNQIHYPFFTTCVRISSQRVYPNRIVPRLREYLQRLGNQFSQHHAFGQDYCTLRSTPASAKLGIADGIRWAKRNSVMARARTRLTTGFLMTRASASARSVEPRSSFLMSYLVGRIVNFWLARRHTVIRNI